MDVIETLGTGVKKNEMFSIQYEPFVKKDHPVFSPEEKEQLREGLSNDDDSDDLGDGASGGCK